MKTFVLFIIALFFTLKLFATPQIPDKLIYKGKEYKLLTFPLETYFKTHTDKRLEKKSLNTGLWRGYIATYEIKNNQLFLKDMSVMVNDPNSSHYTYKSIIDKVFPNQKNIKVGWISGLLQVANGKRIETYPQIYGKIDYEHYLILEFDHGNFKKAIQLTYKQLDDFKDKQFQAFKKTEEYNKLVVKLKKHLTNFDIDSVIRFDILEYTSTILIDEQVASDL